MTLKFELRRTQHAIGEFTATLQFFNTISPVGFTSVLEALKHEADALNLPAAMPVNVFQIAIGQPFSMPPATAQQSTGAKYQRFSSNGEAAESLMCDLASITYSLREYTTWDEVKPRLVGIMSSLASVYIREVPAIQSIRLQYLNEFKASSPDTTSSSEIFQDNSPWISGFHQKQNDAWHSHVGAFIAATDTQRSLVNVNCDVAPAQFPQQDGLYLSANVLILAGCYYNIIGKSPLIVEANDIKMVLNDKFEEAHKLEKDVLRDVISDRYLEAIGAI